MKARFDANDTLSFWMVLPSRSLRQLVYKRLRATFPELNYCCDWNDAKGFGLHLTMAKWMDNQPHSRMYHVPPSALNS